MYRFTFRVSDNISTVKRLVIAATIMQAWEEIRRQYPNEQYPGVALLSYQTIKTNLDSRSKTKRKKR